MFDEKMFEQIAKEQGMQENPGERIMQEFKTRLNEHGHKCDFMDDVCREHIKQSGDCKECPSHVGCSKLTFLMGVTSKFSEVEPENVEQIAILLQAMAYIVGKTIEGAHEDEKEEDINEKA